MAYKYIGKKTKTAAESINAQKQRSISDEGHTHTESRKTRTLRDAYIVQEFNRGIAAPFCHLKCKSHNDLCPLHCQILTTEYYVSSMLSHPPHAHMTCCDRWNKSVKEPISQYA